MSTSVTTITKYYTHIPLKDCLMSNRTQRSTAMYDLMLSSLSEEHGCNNLVMVVTDVLIS